MPVSGICRWCDERVTGNPVLPNARFQDLVLTGEGNARRAHWLKPVDDGVFADSHRRHVRIPDVGPLAEVDPEFEVDEVN